jgi:DNA-binding CsgD family transcriptional regulator
LSLLSKRELEVVQSLAEGLTNREIAERLGLSQHTVKNYLFRVFDKLGVSSRIELLFMTLSQNSPTQALINEVLRDPRNANQNDEAAFALCKQAAEQGGAAAQLALAQMYGARQTPRDLVNAYMWYLIADKQNARARKSLARLMKPEQVLEAEQKAADWIDRSKKPSGVARSGAFEAAGAAAD